MCKNYLENKRDFWHCLGLFYGDTKKQAILRDKFYTRRKKLREKGILDFTGPDVQQIFLNEILSRIRPGATIADLGCGTGHLLAELYESIKRASIYSVKLAGLDLSRWMVKISAEKFPQIESVLFVRGDVYHLPFPKSSFDLLISRTAPYSLKELLKVLKEDGFFIKYDQGPKDYPEISETFGKRYTIQTPFGIYNLDNWKEEEIERHRRAGFKEVSLRDYDVKQYYTMKSLITLIKMVPLVKDFNQIKDRKYLDIIKSRYYTNKGITISRQYFILIAKK